ncbi:minor capsid protein [Capybara microvirus Cap3_SP_333]|nr:minor capsid protein [Capybara microvirus Cap3_SP_333]
MKWWDYLLGLIPGYGLPYLIARSVQTNKARSKAYQSVSQYDYSSLFTRNDDGTFNIKTFEQSQAYADIMSIKNARTRSTALQLAQDSYNQQLEAFKYNADLAESRRAEEYQSEQSQVQRLLAAGINPNLTGVQTGAAVQPDSDLSGSQADMSSDYQSQMAQLQTAAQIGGTILNTVQGIFSFGVSLGQLRLQDRALDLQESVSGQDIFRSRLSSLMSILSVAGQGVTTVSDMVNLCKGLGQDELGDWLSSVEQRRPGFWESISKASDLRERNALFGEALQGDYFTSNGVTVEPDGSILVDGNLKQAQDGALEITILTQEHTRKIQLLNETFADLRNRNIEASTALIGAEQALTEARVIELKSKLPYEISELQRSLKLLDIDISNANYDVLRNGISYQAYIDLNEQMIRNRFAANQLVRLYSSEDQMPKNVRAQYNQYRAQEMAAQSAITGTGISYHSKVSIDQAIEQYDYQCFLNSKPVRKLTFQEFKLKRDQFDESVRQFDSRLQFDRQKFGTQQIWKTLGVAAGFVAAGIGVTVGAPVTASVGLGALVTAAIASGKSPVLPE